jgi:PAS domain S-box-containing protein
MEYEAQEGLAQALFEESGDALFLFDPDSDQILDVNSTAQRLSGFPLREMLRMDATHLFRSDTQGGMARLRQAIRKTGLFHSQEGYLLRTIQDGVWIAVNLTIARLHVKPKTLGLITARDVREQHEAAAELRKANAEFQRMLSASPACVWSADIDEAGQFTFRYFSPPVERITGHAPAFFLAGINRWWGLVHPEDQPRWEKAVVRLRGGESSSEDYRIILPDGSVRWVRERVWVSRLADSRSLHADGLITDITGARQADQRLRESHDRLRALVEGGPLLAALKDADGRLLYVNEAWSRLFDQAAADLVGKTDFDLFPAEEARRLHDQDAAVLNDNRPREAVERVSTPKGGLRRWLVLRFPVEDAGRRLLANVAIDTTEPKADTTAPAEQS